MNPNIEIDNLVRQLMPPHKRKPCRLWFLRILTGRLNELFTDFKAWRNDVRMLVNVNCQVMVLEGYLRKKYNQPISIKIETFDDLLFAVGLEDEGETFMPSIGLIDEADEADIPLFNEIREQFGDIDFVVYIPAGVDIDLVRANIEKYKRALARYRIIQN